MAVDYIEMLLRNGTSPSKVKRLVQKYKPWTIKKIAMDRPLPKVEPWRCPIHGCMLEIEECLECRIDQHRKNDRVSKTFRENP